MATRDEKLKVLSELAVEFNGQNLVWAVGASLLLYLKGYVHDFHDIDIMVADTDAVKMEMILKVKGDIQPSERGSYETKHFRKFLIDGVEVDMMGGLAIVKDGKVYDCDLKSDQIVGNAEVGGQNIPLHSVKLWKKYYMLMGREEKAKFIEKKLYE